MRGNTKYIACHGNEDVNCLMVEVSYELGGESGFSGRQSRRGYYLSVTPVLREKYDGHYLVSQQVFGPLNGKKLLLKEVSRKSDKALSEATLLAEQKKDEFIAFVCAKASLVLDEAAEKLALA